ncbi:MAG: hypothetical protein AAFV53_03820 [Myxococcota bacterium]
MNCVRCHHPIPPDAIAEGMAFCPNCSHVSVADPSAVAASRGVVLTATDNVAYSPGLGATVLTSVSAPSSVQTQTRRDGIVLTLPWRLEATLPGGSLVFLLLVSLPLVLLLIGGADELDYESALFTILFEAGVIYAWLLTAFNQTTVRLDDRGIRFSHGPLPTWNKTVAVPWRKMRRLSIEGHVRRTRYGGRFTTYNLMNGTTEVLTQGWHRRESLEYIQAVIERMAGEGRSLSDGLS